MASSNGSKTGRGIRPWTSGADKYLVVRALEFGSGPSVWNRPVYDDTDGWRLYTIDELAEVMRIDRENVLTIYQMKAFVNSIREFQGDETEDQDGEPYSLDRLAAGLAIGDNNGDVIFLDPEDAFSLWIWYHDGSDVERLADSFDQWLEAATPDESALEPDDSEE